MKTIKLQTGAFPSRDIMRKVIEHPAHGATISVMRAHIRVLDALDKLEAAATELQLEDQDHATLVNAVSATTFTVANRDLLSVIEDIVNAK